MLTFEKQTYTEAIDSGLSEYKFFKSYSNHIFTETKDSICFDSIIWAPCQRNACNNNYLPKQIVHQTILSYLYTLCARRWHQTATGFDKFHKIFKEDIINNNRILLEVTMYLSLQTHNSVFKRLTSYDSI